MVDLSRYESAAYEAQGPDLLALQPLTAPNPEQAKAEWIVAYEKLEGRLGALRNWRYSWWIYWSRLAELFCPRRYVWLVVANRLWRGNPINDAIIDSTGLQAVRTCSAGMWTGLTSPSRPWFAIELADDEDALDADGKVWLQDTQQKIFAVLGRSNFYNVMSQAFEDVTVFGTAPVIMYEDQQDVLRCYLPCAGEYYLGAGARLSVDTLYREFTYTVAEIVEMFDIENCPEQVTMLWKSGGGALETEFVVAHSIEPNFAFQARNGGPAVRIVPGGFTYREVYWLKGQMTDKPLSVRGFRSTPFMVARWATTSNDAYGRSPCMDALGDNKQVQTETLRKAEFIEKGVRPPMGADPKLKNEPASIIPGAITYMSTDGQGKAGFWPLFEPRAEWLVGITNDIDKVNARIEKCLFVDLFMAITRMEGVQPRNELELTQRNQERLQELGPFIHMFENEFAGPAIKRVLDIIQRRGMLLPLPESLRGVPLKINYISIMKLAQRAMESVSMKDVFQTGGTMSAAAKAAGLPDPLRIINLDNAMRRYADINNFPEDSIFTVDQVTEHDNARQQAQQAQQAPELAMAGVTAAKTLSETSLAGGTALGALLGQSPV